ncbi:carbohydrate-binding domain-containing protein [Enterococcus sp. DIV1298c]|uniref:carbohydrate-binding domain-containing protein n=1 Tax=Enterococcus sp. DIV1298c TaxID=2815328 RepID=UPI001A9325B1|nr:carbohydrate-binding domain-containing protein [Enterococcus sp. DIV1298c]MBO0462227.1 carbohydrate-binding domain-containing protein [Enterococcus sp. DIV1298c]
MKKIYSLITASLLLTACSSADSTSSNQASTDASEASTATTLSTDATTTEQQTTYGTYETEDLTTSYEKSSAIDIQLGEKTEVTGEGVEVVDEQVTITQGGTYVISGTLTEGQLIVNVPKEEKVHLIFNGVTITNSNGPAVAIQQTEKAIVTLAENTENHLSDGENYTLAENETEPDATLYSKEDLTINGTGALTVDGNYSNGIRSKDDLILISGTYTINAKNNGLKGKDAVAIKGGNYQITTEEGDGIQATNAEDETKGYVAIDGGTFEINSGRDGIQAETAINSQEAEITIQTAQGADSTNLDTNESYKGMKAGNNVLISSGTYVINSADDSIHTNNLAEITGGTLTLSSGDDGIHTDNELTFNGGMIEIQQSYEGIESAVITFNDGEINVTASDDGINAGGGSDTETTTGQFGADSFGGPPDASDDSKKVIINGGTVYVNAEGDGLDSNGTIEMSGGTMLIDGPVNGGNGALDYGGTFTLTGGTFVAAGSNGMAQTVSDSSTQATVAISYDTVQQADTLMSITSEAGEAVLAYQPSKNYQTIVVSSPQLAVGETYTIASGGSTQTEAENGLSEQPTVSGANDLGTFTFSNTSMTISQSGETVSFGQMGPGGF